VAHGEGPQFKSQYCKKKKERKKNEKQRTLKICLSKK
jgi:hypothetical protein